MKETYKRTVSKEGSNILDRFFKKERKRKKEISDD